MSHDSLIRAVVGTAGHIDHGKTTLVRRLTGIDTDRLPEEKARGISIELGFAPWTFQGGPNGATRFELGVIDVPGHERFIRNMVAGATGVDLALLVVAADDGVMPQTLEHLEIMHLLGIRAGVVAVTKADLVDADYLELVQADITQHTAGTFLECCPVVPVSATSGVGLDALQRALADVALRQVWTQAAGPFRLPIDRVFSAAGHGTIVTGTVLSGEVRTGDVLELHPEGRTVRVRGVQNHGQASLASGSRQRTAVNLAGVKSEELHRGMELSAPGFLKPTHRLLARVTSLARSPLDLRDRLELKLHLGTCEVSARLILKGTVVKPGGNGYCELRLRNPVVATYGQRFILRRFSPETTIAGGVILDPGLAPRERISDVQERGRRLNQPEPEARLAAWLTTRNTIDVAPLEAAWKIGTPAEASALTVLHQELIQQGVLVPVSNTSGSASIVDAGRWLHRDRMEELSSTILLRIRAELAKSQPCRALPRHVLQTACQQVADAELVGLLFDRLLTRGELIVVGDNIGPADAQVALTKNQARARQALLSKVAAGETSPPTLKELANEIGRGLDELQTLAELSVEEGLLVRVGEGLYFTPSALDRARLTCRQVLRKLGPATLSQLREAWQTSRKYAFPLAEYFDGLGITIRQGELRFAGPAVDRPLTSLQ